MLVNIKDDTHYSTTSVLSSDPLRICPCKDNLPNCRKFLQVPNFVYPGETFHISVVAVGQRDGTVSSTVRSTVRTSIITDICPPNLLHYQYLQQTNNTCTKLNYNVFSLSQEVTITLHPEGSSSCPKHDGASLDISVNINQTCPPGFNISESERSCVCEPRLAQYTKQCNITNGLGHITRDSSQHFWVGYDHLSHGLILHPYCPFDYCVRNTKAFPLNNTDIQCEYNRSGLSYANIVGANRTIFLPVKSTDTLSIFVAWLNLDFGIETCFYNGIDAYSNTWLQFVFPAYIWLLVGLMIFISHHSQRFANLLGNNPVSVLATLILLSYTKVLRTLIAVSSFTNLDYPKDYIRRAWLYDANVDYLAGKHIPLFLVAVLVFLFLFLPYTLLLLFGQWLQAISHLRLFSWVNSAKLKPFIDSYHAPYKAKYRYWPGLLLVLRFVLLLVFAINPQQDPNINLLVILLGAGFLQLWAWVSGGVYKHWYLDALEGSLALNLIVLAAATYYVKLSEGNQLAVGYTSINIALATFIGILAYHIFQQLRHTKLWKKVPKLEFKKLNNKLKTKQTKDNLNNPIDDRTESVHFNQLREPLLDDPTQPTHSAF